MVEARIIERAEDRIVITYAIDRTSSAEAEQVSREIAIEQSVEVPEDIIPDGFLRDTILGQVESVRQDRTRYLADISFSPKSVGTSIAQLINLHMGNVSYIAGVRAVELSISPGFWAAVPGARFGVDGIRTLIGKPSGSMIGSVLKPHGLSSDALADLAYRMAIAGVDVIKDDHALSDQTMAPFYERCEKISNAVTRANRHTGKTSLYFSNIAGEGKTLMSHARFASQCGAGVMVLPGLFGFELTRQIASDPEVAVPILSHSAMLGSWVISRDTGFSPHLVFGVFQRLAGADISVFTHAGGRLGLTENECRHVSKACIDPDGFGAPILPCPGGGVGAQHAAGLIDFYSDDVIYLMGGSLLRHADEMADGVSQFRQALEAARRAPSSLKPC